MSSPITPRHSRQSTMDMSIGSSPSDRRLSRSSFNDPTTPTHHLHPSFGNADGGDVFSSGGMGMGMGMGTGGGDTGGGLGGLGNLADELADAWSDEEGEDGEEYDEGDSRLPDGEGLEAGLAEEGGGDVPADVDGAAGGGQEGDGQRDSGVDVNLAKGEGHGHGQGMSLHLPSTNRHHRRTSSAYDGSEYGSDSDLESPGMPPSLVAKMDAVESLARRGAEDNGGPTDGVCKRLTEELRDLGSQANVEGGASRLITAHSALTTHLTHQTRQLHALAFPLFSPLASFYMPGTRVVLGRSAKDRQVKGGNHDNVDDNDNDDNDEEEEDDLLPMLSALADQMPRPSTAAYQSLTALHTLTNDLITTLNYLSDTLHMSRQTTTTATRRLRSAKELVAELRREEELREEGERWLERGDWNARLQRRECAHVCGDVVGGFEEVCNGWRARLLAQAEQAA